MTRNDGPKRTHADLLHATTSAYADMHARLQTVAERAAAKWREDNDNAEVVAAARQQFSSDASTNRER